VADDRAEHLQSRSVAVRSSIRRELQSSVARNRNHRDFRTTMIDSICPRDTALRATQTTLFATRLQSLLQNHITCDKAAVCGRAGLFVTHPGQLQRRDGLAAVQLLRRFGFPL
jgi:hypothetical protein